MYKRITIKQLSSRRYSGMYMFLLLIVFKAILDCACNEVYYIYSTSLSNVVAPERMLTSWLSYIINAGIISFFVLRRKDLLSIVYCMLFLLNGVGFFSIFPLKSQMTYAGFGTVSLFWLVFTILIACCPRTRRTMKFDTNVKVSAFEYLLFGVSAVLAVVYSGVFGNFRIFISFDDVYAYRFQFLEQSLPTVVAYSMRWISGTILPYFFVRYLMRKQRFLAGLTLFLGLLMYGIDGLKTTLLLYVVILYFYFRLTNYIRNKKAMYKIVYEFCILLCAMVYGCYLIYKISGELFLNTELYRVLVIPSNIADNYYNFIHDKEALLLRESILRSFFASPYPKSINYLVSNQINQGYQAIANTGLYGDAYANFKLFGTVLYPLMYMMILRFWQSINGGKTDIYSLSLAFIMIWNAINISFFAWLLTGGVLIFFAITMLKNKVVRVKST